MKKKFNATILIVAVLFTFNACLLDHPYEPPIVEEDEVTSVLIGFTQGAELETRSSVLCRYTPEVPQLNTGDLYLVAPNGTIVEHFRIVEGGSPTPNTVTEIPATDHTIYRNYLRYGVRITNVPVSVRYGRVYLVGNPRVNNPTTGNISIVRNQPVVDMRHQRHRNNQYGGIHLFGYSQLQLVSGSTPETWAPPIYIYTCTCSQPQDCIRNARSGRRVLIVRPIVARIVIPNISAVGKVDGFSVEGVFIDNYYRLATVDGRRVDGTTLVGTTLVPTSLRQNIIDNRSFSENSSGFPNAFQGYTWGWHSPAIACVGQTDIEITRPDGTIHLVNTRRVQLPTLGGSNQPWVFYVFATDTPGRTPHLVFRLYNVVVDGELLPNPQFVTFHQFVMHFSPSPAGGNPFPGITAGGNFHIASNRLMFSEHDLSPVPTTSITLSTRAVPIEVIE